MKYIISVILLLRLIGPLMASGSGLLNQGNRYYQQGDYEKALEKYRQAQIASPGKPQINFNLGDAYYKMENYPEAEREYQNSLSFRDKKLRAAAYYNLGNTAYRQAKLDEAIDFYKKSLVLNPDDEDSKYNLEYVLAQKLSGKKMTSPRQKPPEKSPKTEKSSGEKKESTMSQEDARRLLQPFADADRASAEKRKMVIPRIPKLDKDW